MDTLLLNTKRKKRKTRKCLDELRKRSRVTSITDDSSNTRVSGVYALSKLNGAKNSNNCITSKRLTLTMFAKSVRSETITRPLISAAKQDPITNLDLKSPIITPFNIMVESKSSGTESTPKACVESGNQRSDFDKFQHGSANSSESMILFSPMHKNEKCTVRESANEETVSTITSTSRSVEDLGYNLYEELMEHIPLYLRRNLPSLTKDDVIEKSKNSLNNIYFANLQKHHEAHNPTDEQHVKLNRLTHNRSCVPNDIIVHPMDYIKIGWRQSFEQSCRESSPSIADVSPPQTPHTLCSSEASPQLHSVLPFTPDYEYYPHRLNE